jgi:hypothetical protein
MTITTVMHASLRRSVILCLVVHALLHARVPRRSRGRNSAWEGDAAQAITRALTVFRPLCNRHDIALSAVSRPARSTHRRSGFPSDFSGPTRSSHGRSRAAGARSTDPRDGVRAPARSGIRFRRATSRAGSAPAFAPPRPAAACARGGVGASFPWPSTCTSLSIAPARGLMERSSARRRPGAR